MSTVQRVNFEPVTDILKVHRRDIPLADGSLVNPTSANPLVDGEWVTTNASNQAVRAADIALAGNEATQWSFPVWSEKGRSDVQAMYDKKVPVIYLGSYEFDTRIYDAAADVGSGGAITSNGLWSPLKVAAVTIGGVIYSGLVGHAGFGDDGIIVGRVSRLPATNGTKLRFISTGGLLVGA